MQRNSLQQQLNSLKRKKLDESNDEVQNKRIISQDLGKKSIFYDPDWNPEGRAPLGYRNVPYNPKTFKSNINLVPRMLELGKVPLPKEKRQTR